MGEDADTCPECGMSGAQPGQLLCRGCFVPFSLMTRGNGTGSDPEPTEALPQAEQEAAPTQMNTIGAHALPDPQRTRRDTPPQALRLLFPGGERVSVEPGVRVRLGREPLLCPAVTFLAAHDKLSRVHATVVVEPDGSAWITDEGSTNGTFLHGYRLVPEQRAALRPGDTVRLAADVTVRVLL
jgi:hypothetical protein